MITVQNLCEQERAMPVASFALKTLCHDLRQRKGFWDEVTQDELAEFDAIMEKAECMV